MNLLSHKIRFVWVKLWRILLNQKIQLDKSIKEHLLSTFYNFWWTFLIWLFTPYWCLLWYVQTLQLYRVFSPEWNIFICCLRLLFCIDFYIHCNSYFHSFDGHFWHVWINCSDVLLDIHIIYIYGFLWNELIWCVVIDCVSLWMLTDKYYIYMLHLHELIYYDTRDLMNLYIPYHKNFTDIFFRCVLTEYV